MACECPWRSGGVTLQTAISAYFTLLRCSTNCRCTDKPGKPGEPECEGTTEDSIALTWEPPTKTGGKPIKGYIVEKREKGAKRWTKYATVSSCRVQFRRLSVIEDRNMVFFLWTDYSFVTTSVYLYGDNGDIHCLSASADYFTGPGKVSLR